MDRRTFLGRAGVAVAALTVGRLPRTAPAIEAETVTAAPFDFAALAASGGLVASGGLCAPITPYYSLAIVERPIRDALPRVTADRTTALRFSRPPDA